jgi:hypothetical protein
MSHGIVSKNENSKITDIPALKLAVQEMGGLNFRECEPGKGTYRTWKSDHGSWVGDWDLPEGVSGEEMGNNADFVISLKDNPEAYELGIVRDEKDGCWYPAYDFYMGGYGLEEKIGPIKLQGKKVLSAAPKLMEYYQLMKVGLKNKALGKNVSFQKQEQKLLLFIQ